ncbi:MAG TPA: thioredoxin fold domain-containing protein [Usitatibacter sp.]|nr:thioredoxin fold domain-containing protein [Usitatibacter sp.]
MTTRFLIGLLAFAFALAGTGARAQSPEPSPHAIEIPKWFTESFLDFRDDVRDAAREGKRVMVYFGQDGCPYCKALMQVDFGEPDIVEKTRRHFVAIALNIWGDREVTWADGRTMSEKALARALGVQYTPTLLFLDEQGRVALRLNGYHPPASLRIALDYASLRAPGESFTDYLARRTPADASAASAAAGGPASAEPDFPRALAAGKPVLVLYEYDGCRDCAELRREGFARPEVRALLGKFTVVRLDLAGPRRVVAPGGRVTDERRWARALQVAYAPTLLFLDAHGREVFRSEGYLRPFHLASTLDYVASGAYRSEPSFQRYIQKRGEALRGAGRAVDLWE